jgi:hypothetical protein
LQGQIQMPPGLIRSMQPLISAYGKRCDVGIRHFDSQQQSQSRVMVPVIQHQQSTINWRQRLPIASQRPPGVIDQSDCGLDGVAPERHMDVAKMEGDCTARATREVRFQCAQGGSEDHKRKTPTRLFTGWGFKGLQRYRSSKLFTRVAQ